MTRQAENVSMLPPGAEGFAEAAPPVPAPKHRPVHVIQAEKTAADEKLADMERVNTAYHAKRNRSLERLREFQREWAAKHPSEPYEEEDVPRGAVVLPPDSPVGREFHAQHYVVAELEQELEAAKKAVTGQ